MKKNKKGFTLIDLLAVIVVLAIVMVLAVTTILPYMKEARKNAFVTEANTLKYAAESGVNLIVTGKITNNYTPINNGYCFTLENLQDLGLFKKDNKSYDGIVKIIKKGKNFDYYVSLKNKEYYINDTKSEISEKDVNNITSEMNITYSCNYDTNKDAFGYALVLANADFKTHSLIFTRSDGPFTKGNIYNGKTIVETSKIEDELYTSASNVPWNNYRSTITSIVFEDEIKPISTAYWFQDMILTNVDFSYLNPASISDMSYMFFNATINSISGLNSWDLTSVLNMPCVFCGVKMDSVDISGWNIASTKGPTNISSIFAGAELANVNISNWILQSTFDISKAFNASVMTTNVNLSNWNTSKVTNMSSMFSNATINSNIDLSGWNTSNVTDMSSMFAFVTMNNDYGIENWNTSKVTNMSSMFSNATINSNIDLSGWNTSNVTDMSSMFAFVTMNNDYGIENWNTSKVTNMSYFFEEVTLNVDLDLSGWDTSSITNYNGFDHHLDGTGTLTQPKWE